MRVCSLGQARERERERERGLDMAHPAPGHTRPAQARVSSNKLSQADSSCPKLSV